MTDFTYGDLRKGLLEGKTYRHSNWAEGQYIMGNIVKGHFEVIRFRDKHTELYPIGLYFDDEKCNLVEYIAEVKAVDHSDVMQRLSEGEKLTHKTWSNAYIYNEAVNVGKIVKYSGPTMKYWRQSNGAVITEPYELNIYDTEEWLTINKDQVASIWGYHEAGNH